MSVAVLIAAPRHRRTGGGTIPRRLGPVRRRHVSFVTTKPGCITVGLVFAVGLVE
jgi:hypothetical protein